MYGRKVEMERKEERRDSQTDRRTDEGDERTLPQVYACNADDSSLSDETLNPFHNPPSSSSTSCNGNSC